jgi:hypothetical protein
MGFKAKILGRDFQLLSMNAKYGTLMFAANHHNKE